MSSIIVNNTERNWRKTIKASLAFSVQFWTEISRSLYLAPPLHATSCNVHYSGSIWQWKRDLEHRIKMSGSLFCAWSKSNVSQLALLLVYSCLLVFLSREKNSYHNHRVLLLILWPQHATKRKHRSDSVLHAYAW
jgi:hypothetical protein